MAKWQFGLTQVIHITIRPFTLKNINNFYFEMFGQIAIRPIQHPAGTSVSSVKYDKPVHSASHYGQWDHFFLACGQTNSVENM